MDNTQPTDPIEMFTSDESIEDARKDFDDTYGLINFKNFLTLDANTQVGAMLTWCIEQQLEIKLLKFTIIGERINLLPN